MRSFHRVFQPISNRLGRISGALARSSTRTAALSLALVVASTVSVWATANTPPSNLTFTAVPSVVNEGESFTVTGTFIDPDVADLHSVVINWFDGKKEKIQVPAGQLSFTVTHTYKDNPESYPNFPKWIAAALIADKDAPGAPNENTPGDDHWDSGAVVVEVRNVAPTFAHNVYVGRVRGEPGKVVITGDVVDPGEDTVEVFAHWGQSFPQLGMGQACTMTGKRAYRCEHTYPVPQIGQKSYTVKLTARDDEGDHTSTTKTVTLP